jgi:hypothetical protein
LRALLRLLVLLGLVLSGAALAPLAVADPSSPASPRPGATTPRAPAGPTAKAKAAAKAGTKAASPARAAAPPPLTTTIHAHPRSPAVTGKATFSYSANRAHQTNVPGVQFRCVLTGPGHPKRAPATCPVDAASGSTTTGHITYTRLTGSRKAYRFAVQAYIPKGIGNPPSSRVVLGDSDAFRWRVFNVVSAKRAYVPSNGPSFNRPLSSQSKRRTNLTRVIRTVNGMPGYKQAYPGLCPTAGAYYPGTIRISLYSLVDERVARALIKARHRCINVQVLMNDHLSRHTDSAWRHLEDALGTRTFRGGHPTRSFAHRCHRGCRGGGVLHTKMYLFNSTLRPARLNRLHTVVMFGSTNMTSNAAKVQWNDLFVQRGNSGLFDTFGHMFNLLKRDNGYHRTPGTITNGVFQTTFWPQAHGALDPYMRALRQVHCTGATGGTGIHGRTVVYINMHAWFGTRGLALARQVRKMYAHGCYVRVLYGFMSFRVFKILHSHTGGRMSVRRTLFSHDGHTGYVYTHFKNIDISGHVGGDTSAKVIYTGSNNFTNEGLNFDEVMVRIASGRAYNRYVRQFAYMRKRMSSATYANFSEPSGGGRAPRIVFDNEGVPHRIGVGEAPAGTPVISSDAIRFDVNGEPHAVD